MTGTIRETYAGNPLPTIRNTDIIPIGEDPGGTPADGGINFDDFSSQIALPVGGLKNGKLSVTVATNDLTVAVKTIAGTDPSATDPVHVNVNGVEHVIVAALSITILDSVNTFNAGSTELATKEIDYFAYIGYNATDGVVLGVSRIPSAKQYDDFSTTATNEKYCKISTITTAAATDAYCVIGRFAATLSAGAGYVWTVPTFTPKNLVQYPIYITRWLTWTPTITGYSANPTDTIYMYMVDEGANVHIEVRESTAGTSNATSVTLTAPFTAITLTNMLWIGSGIARDNGTVNNSTLYILSNTDSLVGRYGVAFGAWTNSGDKAINSIRLKFQI